MFFTWTQAGLDYIDLHPAVPPAFDNYRLGSSYNYTPSASTSSLVGQVVWSGVPSQPIVLNDTLYQVSFVLDRAVTALTFGEVGLYLGGVLFAVASSNTAHTKALGEQLTFDGFCDTSGTVYLLYAQVSSSDNAFTVPVGGTVDSLPPVDLAPSNVMLVQLPSYTSNAVLAHHFNGRWSVAGYDIVRSRGTMGAQNVVLEIPVTSWESGILPTLSYPGELILQFTSGRAQGVLRVVRLIASSSGTSLATLSMFTAFLAGLEPVAGDTFVLLGQSNGSASAGGSSYLLDADGLPLPPGTRIATLPQLYSILSTYGGSGNSGGYVDAFGNPV